MKILTLIVISLVISCVMSKETNSAQKVMATEKTEKVSSQTEEKKQVQVDHLPDTPLHGAVANDPFILQHQAGFKSAMVLPYVPLSLNKDLNTGKIENADTFITNKSYYDGSNNLSAIHVDCNIFSTNPPSCVKQSGCGWCGEKNSCVSGTSAGPLGSCIRGTFLFSMPSPEWNPLKAGTINILAVDSRGQPQNIITPEPNLRKADVYNPYK